MTYCSRYGDEKSACEMLFSYGFIADDVSSAKALYLDLEIPGDDPLKRPKLIIAKSAPGFHVREDEGRVSWNSDFIWLICINEEDGLSFQVQQTVSGDRELVAFWKGIELTNASKLGSFLEKDSQRDLYLLRAVCTMQDRVRGQLILLAESEELVQQHMGQPDHTSRIRMQPLKVSKRLRELENKLLNDADSFFETEVCTPLSSNVCVDILQLSSCAARLGTSWRGNYLFK